MNKYVKQVQQMVHLQMFEILETGFLLNKTRLTDLATGFCLLKRKEGKKVQIIKTATWQ